MLAPHSSHYADVLASDRLAAYLAARAAGGVGLIVHEPVVVHRSSWSRRGKVLGYDARNVEHYRRTTDAVHAHGARIFCQLIHNGMHVDGHTSGMPAWYPVERPRTGTAETTHAMTRADIEAVVDGFAVSARHCVAGGLDGLEIHAAHGYLLQAFLSPATNRRTDEYGGSAAGRLRMLTDIVAAVRAEVGAEVAVGVRLSGDEHQPGGLDAEATLEIARELARTPIDYLSVVSGSTAAQERVVPDAAFPRAVNAELAAGIRGAVAPLPVVVTGRIAEPADAEAVLAAGQADLVGVVRALIADPDWVRKAADGVPEEIRPCVYGNDCNAAIGARRPLSCTVNPDAGREHAVVEAPVRRARRVVVIGGGVAGMEAALTASARGDRVTLLERDTRLGGQVLLASAAPERRELARIAAYLSRRVERRRAADGADDGPDARRDAGLDLRLATEATPELVAGLAPDLIVLAAGAGQRASGFGGADPDAVTLSWQVLDGTRPVPSGARVVLVDEEGGNGWPFWTVADLLSGRGHPVTVVTGSHAVASAIISSSVPDLLRRLGRRGVRVTTMTAVESRDAGGLTVRNTMTGRTERWSDVDALVADPGRGARSELAVPLSAIAPVVAVGDALAPRTIATAIRDGRDAVGGSTPRFNPMGAVSPPASRAPTL